jgi:hypothetical protein
VLAEAAASTDPAGDFSPARLQTLSDPELRALGEGISTRGVWGDWRSATWQGVGMNATDAMNRRGTLPSGLTVNELRQLPSGVRPSEERIRQAGLRPGERTP